MERGEETKGVKVVSRHVNPPLCYFVLSKIKDQFPNDRKQEGRRKGHKLVNGSVPEVRKRGNKHENRLEDGVNTILIDACTDTEGDRVFVELPSATQDEWCRELYRETTVVDVHDTLSPNCGTLNLPCVRDPGPRQPFEDP